MTPDRVRSREELVQLVAQGIRPDYFFFWGHQPLPNGRDRQIVFVAVVAGEVCRC